MHMITFVLEKKEREKLINTQKPSVKIAETKHLPIMQTTTKFS